MGCGFISRLRFPFLIITRTLSPLSNNRFVNLRLAASIVVCYWCTARYEEAMKLIVGNMQKRGLSVRVMIKKGKRNLEMKPQLAVVQPNSRESVGNYCPVKILEAYMRRRLKIALSLLNHNTHT